MRRATVSVATTTHYQRGMQRLYEAMNAQGYSEQRCWTALPPGSPTHQDVPYAFKAHALQAAADEGFDTLLWADACIYPVRDMKPLWEQIERDGYWFSENGFRNNVWTCREAYPLLGVSEAENALIEHVVATSFGISIRHEKGRAFLGQYLALAKNGAFRGPWVGGIGIQHRHDQTAASVIAHRLNMQLTKPPSIFAYGKAGTDSHPETIIIADGSY